MAAVAYGLVGGGVVLAGGYTGAKACSLARSAWERLTVSPEASYQRLEKNATSQEKKDFFLINSQIETAFIHNYRVLSIGLRVLMLLGAVLAIVIGGVGSMAYLLKSNFSDQQLIYAACATATSLFISFASNQYYLLRAVMKDWR